MESIAYKNQRKEPHFLIAEHPPAKLSQRSGFSASKEHALAVPQKISLHSQGSPEGFLVLL